MRNNDTRLARRRGEADVVQTGRDRGYAAALLMAGYCFAYTDRQVVNVLLPSFKRSLGLTLVQASLIQGLASTFWQLFLARLTVGIGEACHVPTSASLLADDYPLRPRLARLSSIRNGFGARLPRTSSIAIHSQPNE